MKSIFEDIRNVLENNRSKTDISRLMSISDTLTKSLQDLYKLEKLIEVSSNEKLLANKKNLLDKIDKYHKLFSEVYKNPKYSLKEDNLLSEMDEESAIDEASVSSRASSQTAAFVKFLNDNSGNRLVIAKEFDIIADAADDIAEEEAGGIGGLSKHETRWNGIGNILRKVVVVFK